MFGITEALLFYPAYQRSVPPPQMQVPRSAFQSQMNRKYGMSFINKRSIITCSEHII